jgi:hypothetical protein
MRGEDGKGDEMAYGRHNRHTSLAELNVDARIGKGSDGVSDKGSKEDERYDGVTEVIVLFELSIQIIL